MSATHSAVFPPEGQARFATLYPNMPGKLRHRLTSHPLLTLDALAELAAALPADSIEYNPGKLPIGIAPEDVPASDLGVVETIRGIANAGSWVALKRIEQSPEYARLLRDVLGELEEIVTPRTGAMMQLEGFVFITSPGSVTPFHFDPEHNILLQIRGSKVMTQFPAGDARFAPDEVHESYHTGGPRELTWRDELLDGGREFPLDAGDALFVPVMAPHFVRTGPASSVSLSITWRSEWSFAEADARAFNAALRRMGIAPRQPGRWPSRNLLKATGWRVMRKLGIG